MHMQTSCATKLHMHSPLLIAYVDVKHNEGNAKLSSV